jgi:GNAT superfamily N-acetyltransferase
MNVVPRQLWPESDVGFILSTMPKSVFYGAPIRPSGNKREWFDEFFLYLKDLLGQPDTLVTIACLDESPETIIGYSIISGVRLHYVYVKSDFRRQGVGRMLAQGFESVEEKNLTKVGMAILAIRIEKELRYDESNSADEGSGPSDQGSPTSSG